MTKNTEMQKMTKLLQMFKMDTELVVDNLLAPTFGFSLDHKETYDDIFCTTDMKAVGAYIFDTLDQLEQPYVNVDKLNGVIMPYMQNANESLEDLLQRQNEFINKEIKEFNFEMVKFDRGDRETVLIIPIELADELEPLFSPDEYKRGHVNNIDLDMSDLESQNQL